MNWLTKFTALSTKAKVAVIAGVLLAVIVSTAAFILFGANALSFIAIVSVAALTFQLRSKVKPLTTRITTASGLSTKTLLTVIIGVVSSIVIAILFWDIARYFAIGLLSITSLTIGFFVTVYGFVFLSKFWATQQNPKVVIVHNPDEDARTYGLVKVKENRAVVIERAGDPIWIIQGGQDPDEIEILKTVRSPIFPKTLHRLFKWYERYIYDATGLYAYIPLFTKPKVLPFPRYNVKPRNGKNEYVVIEEGDKGYFTNHVRTAITTWYFEYKGVDLEGIPFDITGSIQYSINRTKVREALYETDAWNVLMDQSAITVIRSTVRHDASIDKVLGRTSKDVWKAKRKSPTDIYRVIAELVLMNLQEFEFDVEVSADYPTGKMKLSDIGIQLHGILFNDFEPDLTPEELKQLRAPALQQRVARGEDIRGTTVANNQKKLVDAHEAGGEASGRILEADALVRATQGGGGLVEALIATFIQKNRGGN